MNPLLHRSPEQTRLCDLIAEIESTHHTFTRTELERIDHLLRNMLDAGLPDLDEINRHFSHLHAELVPHLMKEENILFPFIIALERDPAHPPKSCFGSVANPIYMMRVEHASSINLLESLRSLTSNYRIPLGCDKRIEELYSALARLDEDLVQHIHWENDVLFPRALQLEESAST